MGETHGFPYDFLHWGYKAAHRDSDWRAKFWSRERSELELQRKVTQKWLKSRRMMKNV